MYTPYTTFKRLPAVVHVVFSNVLTPGHIEPRLCILDSWSSLPTVFIIHYTTFSSHIRSLITSTFGRTTYLIATSLKSRQITYTGTFSCCIVTVISPRKFLRALAEHPEATFSAPKCASFTTPIVLNSTFQFITSQ
jgi:hypothetical protein